jgi:hypothetical protein
MIGFIGTSATVLLITINCNSSQSTTVSDSHHALLDYECLLFSCDGLGSDLRVGHFFSFRCSLVSTPQLNTELTYESRIIEISWTELNSPFVTSRRAKYSSPFRKIRLLLLLFVAAGICFPNRCPATNYLASIRCHGNVC